jgi:hypothetical protein
MVYICPVALSDSTIVPASTKTLNARVHNRRSGCSVVSFCPKSYLLPQTLTTGADYIFALLTGYREPPAGVTGMHKCQKRPREKRPRNKPIKGQKRPIDIGVPDSG